jgi:hypothetical protein
LISARHHRSVFSFIIDEIGHTTMQGANKGALIKQLHVQVYKSMPDPSLLH